MRQTSHAAKFAKFANRTCQHYVAKGLTRTDFEFTNSAWRQQKLLAKTELEFTSTLRRKVTK